MEGNLTKMAKSKCVEYTRLSPHYNRRYMPISKITIHHMAGNLSVETCGEIFAKYPKSSNYGIGSDGRIACYVDESNRSWCSSSEWNDQRAITIEVANDTYAPNWTVSKKAYDSLIRLCADICERHQILPMYDGTINGSLTEHRMFSATLCCGPTLHNMLSNGTIQRDIINLMNKGEEKQKEWIDLLYKNILKRKADDDGRNHWNMMLKYKKLKPHQVVSAFFNSEEYRKKNTSNDKFIDDLYFGILNRKADSNGRKYWSNQLSKGATRQTLLNGFVTSHEFGNIIAKFNL